MRGKIYQSSSIAFHLFRIFLQTTEIGNKKTPMEAIAKNTEVKSGFSPKAKMSFFSNLNFGVIPALFVAILPKCPLCVAAYLSAFGFAGISPVKYGFWLVPLTIFFSALTAVIFFRQARQSGKYHLLFLSLIGLIFISVGKFYLEYNPAIYTGSGILLISAILLARANRPAQCVNHCKSVNLSG